MYNVLPRIVTSNLNNAVSAVGEHLRLPNLRRHNPKRRIRVFSFNGPKNVWSGNDTNFESDSEFTILHF